ncbi:MAG: hypothetical protein HC898_04410 [Phycisphaerales bacterium]|nr:hypothetical protein [Phycisphaerales bacterium]
MISKGLVTGVMALAAGGVFAGNAMAINFGTYKGDVVMKLIGFDEGTIYTGLADGTYGGTGNTANDIATMNGLPQFAPRSNSSNSGDTWGIFQIREITDPTGTVTIYNHATASKHLVGIFWGLKDTKITVSAGGSFQQIAGVDIHTAVFEVPVGSYDPSGGALAAGSWAGGNPVFPTVTTGDLIWTWSSIPGSNPNDPTNEFFTNFLPQGLGPGIAISFGDWVAALGPVPFWGEGPDNGQLEGELEINFTAEGRLQDTFGGKWLLRVDDPIRVQVRPIPEPATVGLGLISLLALSAGVTRRRA